MAETWQRRTMRDILRILFTRWLSAVIILGAVVTATVVVTLYAPRIYQADVTLTYEVGETDTEMAGNIRTDSIWEVLLKTQHEVLTSDKVISRALACAEKGYSRGQDVLAALRPGDDPTMAAARKMADDIETEAGYIRDNRQQEMAELRESIRMEVPGGTTVGRSQVFTIYVRVADDPQRAKRLADMVQQEFVYAYHETVVHRLRQILTSAEQNRDALQAEYDILKKRYSEFLDKDLSAQQALADLAQIISLEKGPSANVGDAVTFAAARQKLSDVESDLAEVTKLKEDLDAALANLKEPGDVMRVLPYVPEDIRLNNPAITQYGEALARQISNRIAMEQEFSDDYQELVQLRVKIRKHSDYLVEVLKSVADVLGTRKEQLARRAAVYGKITSIDNEDVGSADRGRQLTQLQTFQTEWNTLRDEWQERLVMVNKARQDYQEAVAAPRIYAIDLASVPHKHVQPKEWLNITIGVVFGLLLALTYVFLADFYDHTVRSMDDVERYLGVPVLTSVRKMRNPIRR